MEEGLEDWGRNKMITKISLMISMMAILMLGIIPLAYAHYRIIGMVINKVIVMDSQDIPAKMTLNAIHNSSKCSQGYDDTEKQEVVDTEVLCVLYQCQTSHVHTTRKDITMYTHLYVERISSICGKNPDGCNNILSAISPRNSEDTTNTVC